MKKQTKNSHIFSSQGSIISVAFTGPPTKKEIEHWYNYYLKNNLSGLICLLKDDAPSVNDINSDEYDLRDNSDGYEAVCGRNSSSEEFLSQGKYFMPHRMGNDKYKFNEKGLFWTGGDNDGDYTQYSLEINQILVNNKFEKGNRHKVILSILITILFFLIGGIVF